MKKKNKVFSYIGLAITVLVAGITAFSDEMASRKNEEQMEDMENRIKSLEDKGPSEN